MKDHINHSSSCTTTELYISLTSCLTDIKNTLQNIVMEFMGGMVKLGREAKIKNRYNQVTHLTRNAIWESDKTQENTTLKRAKRSAISQQVITRLQGMDKTAEQRQTSNINKKKKDP